MKKLILPLFVILLAALPAACGMNPVPAEDGVSRGDGDNNGGRRELPKYITLRLSDSDEYAGDSIGISLGNTVSYSYAADATDSRSESRALSSEYAQAFHDFFEVVFFYTGNNRVARAVWKIGEIPELRGVHRTGNSTTPGSGIDYSSIDIQSGPAANTGFSMLFAGTEDDKTLLAIGRLAEVEGVPGTTMLYTDTKSVTFAVTALKAGTSFSTDKANSSFLTAYGAGATSNNDANVSTTNTTILDNVFIHYESKDRKFPLYLVNRPTGAGVENPGTNSTTRARYYFNVDGGSTNFTQFARGIILAGGYNCEVRNPRYIITGGLYQYSSIFVQDKRDGLVVMNDNNAPVGYTGADRYFENPVHFQIVTTNSPNGSIFALVFEIYVNNLTRRATSAESSGDNNKEPVRWRISTGAGTKWLDLDDGTTKSEGGAILLGSGNITDWLSNVPGAVTN